MRQLLNRRGIAAAVVVVLSGSAGIAAPTINGSLDAEYGTPIVVQNNPTDFGDSTSGAVNMANGSELDAAYGIVTGGNLDLFFAGNVRTDGSHLDVFINSGGAGGENTLQPLADDHINFNRMAAAGSQAGLTFDGAFDAQYFLSAAPTNFGSPIVQFDYANLFTGANGLVGTETNFTNGTLTAPDPGLPTIEGAIDDSNILGVTDLTAPNNAASVSTGVEFSIPLSAIGNPTGAINICAFVASDDQGSVSNQVAGDLPDDTTVLGETRNVNFANFAGNQYFTVGSGGGGTPIPLPASARFGLAGLAAVITFRSATMRRIACR